MRTHQIQELGEIIRKVRKKHGLRLEDLADDNISVATISNIERGVPHVSMDKSMYLLDRLNIETSQIPKMLMDEENEIHQIHIELEMVESLWRFKQYDKALKKIKILNLDDYHPYAATAVYLKGKCLIDKGKLKQAERALYSAIKLANQHQYNKGSNIETASFCELAIIAYVQNDLDGALQFINSAWGAFRHDGDRQYLWFILHRNKAVFLDKLSRINEAMSVVQEVWDSLHMIDNIDTRLTFYWMHAELLRRTHSYDQALKIAKKGLDLAVENTHSKYIFDFWTLLGCVYTVTDQLDKAESCFKTALHAKNALTDTKSLTTTYTKLGVLYLQKQKYTEAKEALSNAIENGEKLNDAPRLTYALMVMGDYMKVNEGLKEATHYYQRALELSQKYQLKRREYRLLLKLQIVGIKLMKRNFRNVCRICIK